MDQKRHSCSHHTVKNYIRLIAACILATICVNLPGTSAGNNTETKSCRAKIFHGRSLSFNISTTDHISPGDMTPLEVNVAFLTPIANNGIGKLFGGAFFLAIDELNRIAASKGIPVRFNWTFRDTGNQEATAINRMADLYCAQKVSAFIGPDAYCKPSSVVATAFHIPYITFKCDELHNDTGNHLMVNTETSFAFVSRYITAVLQHYKWKSFWVVTGRTIKWQSVAKELRDNAQYMNISINGETVEEANDEFISIYLDSNPYRNTLHASRYRTRVYVFLGDYECLLMFLREMKALGMTGSGEYAVIATDDSGVNSTGGKIYLSTLEFHSVELSKEMKKEYIQSFQNTLIIKPQKLDINRNDFENAVYAKNILPPLNLKKPPPLTLWKPPLMNSTESKLTHDFGRVDIPSHAYHLYDATMFYGRAVMALMAIPGADPLNATHVIYYMRCRFHKSIQGNKIWIHSNGMSEESYKVVTLAFDEPGLQEPQFLDTGTFSLLDDDDVLIFTQTNPVQWVSGQPPISNPVCGFDGKLCASSKLADWKVAIVVASVLIFVLIIIVILILGIRHYMYEQKLERLAWKIEREEIQILNPGQFREMMTPSRPRKKDSYSGNQLMSNFLLAHEPDPDIISDSNYNSEVIPVGVYRGTNVAVRKLTRKNLELTRALKKQLQLRKELTHENINRFIGACIEIPHIYMVTQYCTRKSLQDILRNENSPLDDMFITSLVQDMIRGMHFIHESEIGFHGNLKSSNCLVDTRWTVKITDFGLTAIGPPVGLVAEDEEFFRGLLWTAPELLPYRRRRISTNHGHSHPYHHGSLSNNNTKNRNFIVLNQKGDVYSFAIILYELYGKSGPWGNIKMTNKEIIETLLSQSMSNLRPDISNLTCNANMVSMIQDCWDEDPNFRPDFKYGIRTRFKPIQQGYLKSNIFDNMLAMMEKYANNLEVLVAERTEQLRLEKRMTENLLLRMLPRSVADKLKRGLKVEPEQFQLVSIYFSDIVGFTEISADSTPMEVVDLLNDLYTCFDSIIEEFDVYKVETIGDAYMVVSGLPIRNGDRHAGEIASMALLILEAIKQKRFRIRGTSDYMVKVRIGIHSGPCCAGVVGLKMPRYCLFGDTVNTASRIETTGEAMKIHCSADCKKILDKLGGYCLEERGFTEMKGKGSLLTYFLQSEDVHHRHKRMSSFKKMTNDAQKNLHPNSAYGSKLYNFGGGKGVSHNHLHPERVPLSMKNYATKDFGQFSNLRKITEQSWSDIPEELPQLHSCTDDVVGSALTCPVVDDRNCDGDIETVSYSNSFDNNMSETHSLLDRYEHSDTEPSSCASSSDPKNRMVLLPLTKTEGWGLNPLTENVNRNGIKTFHLDMSEIAGPETVM